MSKSLILNHDTIAAMFKALSNPHRLHIFMRLANCCHSETDFDNKCCDRDAATAYVGQLGKQLDIAPSTVSHHIKELNNAGLIRMKRKGQNIMCWVEPQTIANLSDFFKFNGGS